MLEASDELPGGEGGGVPSPHEGPPFVVPSCWTVGSARVLEAMGFQALATTSLGFAYTLAGSMAA